jgi:adenosine deaminase
MPAHPVAKLIEAGVCVTISTDDTFMFGNSLVEEYYALVADLGFSRNDLVRVARNGIETALLDKDQRRAILAELDQIAAAV